MNLLRRLLETLRALAAPEPLSRCIRCGASSLARRLDGRLVCPTYVELENR
jgi:hypothetical protein